MLIECVVVMKNILQRLNNLRVGYYTIKLKY